MTQKPDLWNISTHNIKKIVFIDTTGNSGGNIVLKSLYDFGKRYKTSLLIEFETFELKRGPSKLSTLLNILSIAAFYLKLRWKNRKNCVQYVFSDPLAAIFSIFLPAKTRVRYVQSDDFNLFSRNDGYSIIFLFFYKALVKLSSLYSYKNIFFNSAFTYQCFARPVARQIIFPVVELNIPSPDDVSVSNVSKKEAIEIAGIWRKNVRKGLRDFLEITELMSDNKMIKFKLFVSSGSFVDVPKHIDVVYVKERIDLLQELGKVDVFLNTSGFEGFGLPVWEALKLGKPVISRLNGGLLSTSLKNYVLLYSDVSEACEIIESVIIEQSRYFGAKNINTIKDAASRFDPVVEHQNFYSYLET